MTSPLLRAFRPGDETGILDLYRVVFKLAMTPEEWRWYYQGASAGRPSPSVIAVAEAEDGRIVGHYAVQPRPFCLSGRRCLSGLVMGSMVAPEFRNIATFIDLAKMAYSMSRERGIELVYAFPNDNVWLVRQRMLDWQALPSLVSLVAPPGELRVPEIDAAGIPELAPDHGFPGAEWMEPCAAEGIRAVHTPDWLSWRLRERPGVEYPLFVHRASGEVTGYIALKRYRAADGRVDGHVVAWRVKPGEEESSGVTLLARAKVWFEGAGVDRVSMWLLPRSPLHGVAVRAGLRPGQDRKNFGYLALDGGLEGELSAPDRWDVTMSDSDVF